VGCYRRARGGGRLELVERFEIDVVGAVTEVGHFRGRAVDPFDLVLLNDLDLTYAKVRFDADDLHILEEGGIGDLEDPMARALCWSGIWHLTRDGVLPGSRFVEMVLKNIGRETDISVVQTLLRQLRQVKNHYVDASRRPAVARRLGEAVWANLESADAAGDQQLAYAYAAAWASSQQAELQRLAGFLDGTESLPGLEIDQDLRWAYLEALAAAGLDDDGARASAEAAGDDTASGRRRLAAARASRPLAEAKAEAWKQAVETPDQPNELIAAILTGFEQPGQEKLLEPYVEPYFDGLARVWAGRSIENANRIVSYGFPALLASSALIERTEAWLASGDASAPALRRLVQEGRDDAVRALAAQSCDGSV